MSKVTNAHCGDGPEWRLGQPEGDGERALSIGDKLSAAAPLIAYVEDSRTCIVEGCTEPDLHDFVRLTRGGRSIIHLHDEEPADE